MANRINRNRVRILVLREARLSVSVFLASRHPITVVYVFATDYVAPDITSVIRRRVILPSFNRAPAVARHTRSRLPAEDKSKTLCCAALLATASLRDHLCGSRKRRECPATAVRYAWLVWAARPSATASHARPDATLRVACSLRPQASRQCMLYAVAPPENLDIDKRPKPASKRKSLPTLPCGF